MFFPTRKDNARLLEYEIQDARAAKDDIRYIEEWLREIDVTEMMQGVDAICKQFGWEYDVPEEGNHIIVHVPKCVISMNNKKQMANPITIYDIYVQIDYFMVHHTGIKSFVKFTKTSYTPLEARIKPACHPHIGSDGTHDYTDTYCMGSTPFIIPTDKPELNVPAFLLYLNTFLSHIGPTPYTSASTYLQKPDSAYYAERVRDEWSYGLSMKLLQEFDIDMELDIDKGCACVEIVDNEKFDALIDFLVDNREFTCYIAPPHREDVVIFKDQIISENKIIENAETSEERTVYAKRVFRDGLRVLLARDINRTLPLKLSAKNTHPQPCGAETESILRSES